MIFSCTLSYIESIDLYRPKFSAKQLVWLAIDVSNI